MCFSFCLCAQPWIGGALRVLTYAIAAMLVLAPVERALGQSPVSTIALSGQSAPGAPGTTFSQMLVTPSINDAGDVLIAAQLQGPSVTTANNQGIWLFNSGQADLIARLGDVAPQTKVDVYFTGFGTYSQSLALGSDGSVAFQALVTPNGVIFHSNIGVWNKPAGGELGRVARGYDATPHDFGETTRFRRYNSAGQLPVSNNSLTPFGALRFDDAGDTHFLAHVVNSSFDTSGASLWQGSQYGDLQLVLAPRAPVPGLPGSQFYSFHPGHGVTSEVSPVSPPAVNGQGAIAFTAYTFPNQNLSQPIGLWSNRNGAGPEPIVLPGQQAPGYASGNTFVQVGNDARNLSSDVQSAPESPAFNDAGDVAFRAFVNGPEQWVPVLHDGIEIGWHHPTDEGIWIDRGKSLALLAAEGRPAPGTAPDVVFQSPAYQPDPDGPLWFQGEAFGAPAINTQGTVAFAGRLGGVDVSEANDWGLWKGTSAEDLTLVVREGDQAPGLPEEVLFAALPTRFGGGGPPRPGGWRGNPHRPPAVAALNGLGQIAFAATLTGPDLDPKVDHGLWAQDLAGNLQLIAVSGGVIDVAGDGSDLRTISLVGFIGSSGNEDGQTSGFNDLGQLAFFAEFTDGTSGIFISNLVAVPEPGTLALAAIGLVALILRRMSGR